MRVFLLLDSTGLYNLNRGTYKSDLLMASTSLFAIFDSRAATSIFWYNDSDVRNIFIENVKQVTL